MRFETETLGRHVSSARSLAARCAGALIACVLCSACGATHDNGYLGTVDLGDDFVAPDLQLDQDFFFCRIQPDVLTRHSCAGGADGEGGSCHDSRSALRLLATEAAPPCEDGAVISEIPEEYAANLDAVRFSVQSDPLTSPLYLRPLGRASHPRPIFDEDDEAAELIVEWISGAAP